MKECFISTAGQWPPTLQDIYYMREGRGGTESALNETFGIKSVFIDEET